MSKDFTLLEASFDGNRFFVSQDERFQNVCGNKGAEYRYLGDTNLNEIFGLNIEYYRGSMYITPADYDDIENSNNTQWIQMKKSLLSNVPKNLQLPDYPATLAIPVPNQEITLTKYRGWYKIDIVFSTAPVSLNNNNPIQQGQDVLADKVGKEQVSFMKKALKFGKNAQAKIAKLSGQAAIISSNINYYASNVYAITNITSIINDAVDSITGNLSFLASSISAVRSSLLNIPNDVANFTKSFQNSIAQFVNVLNTPSLTIDGLLQVAQYGDNIQSPNNQSQTALDVYNNEIALACLIKIEALKHAYLQTQYITFITTDQINNLIAQEVKLYKFLINNNATSTSLIEMRNIFYNTVLQILQTAVRIERVNVIQPTSLRTLVFKYNQNLDYLEETRRYNQITNTSAVQGQVYILLN